MSNDNVTHTCLFSNYNSLIRCCKCGVFQKNYKSGWCNVIPDKKSLITWREDKKQKKVRACIIMCVSHGREAKPKMGGQWDYIDKDNYSYDNITRKLKSRDNHISKIINNPYMGISAQKTNQLDEEGDLKLYYTFKTNLSNNDKRITYTNKNGITQSVMSRGYNITQVIDFKKRWIVEQYPELIEHLEDFDTIYKKAKIGGLAWAEDQRDKLREPIKPVKRKVRVVERTRNPIHTHEPIKETNINKEKEKEDIQELLIEADKNLHEATEVAKEEFKKLKRRIRYKNKQKDTKIKSNDLVNMSDTEIFEGDENIVVESVMEDKPKPVSKPKKKAPLKERDPEAYARLCANLAKGRETSAKKRKQTATAKKIKKRAKEDEEVALIAKEAEKSDKSKAQQAEIDKLKAELEEWKKQRTPVKPKSPSPPPRSPTPPPPEPAKPKPVPKPVVKQAPPPKPKPTAPVMSEAQRQRLLLKQMRGV